MSFRPDTNKFKQEMPPPGGFPKVDVMEKMRSRGPSGAMIWGVSVAMITYGYYLIGEHNKKYRLEKFREQEARLAMIPFLQAESDLDWLYRRDKLLEREAKIMEGVEGWEVGGSVYYSKTRWVADPPFRLQKMYK
mmetsp:Transcript_27570/g.57702  ORF Transcript_27570/g.57702 Transcript_27570/m.57702 type:complete len:135 (-) Transcript_27570:196-600(-)|eukprot:CAMPEP_0172439574 /NCGR_PEP_ID=MMETSP1065-20121228/512_1 /TAXON_ID=265537 /ORGANISM="Amphiprora paludosa, Strain CCMP125" /LENGTH=134 /DNA_ID=CAMNT_0013188273 /DNA_START=79 /DNA_END=483 /DNA_ORIENTATION=+